MKRKYLKTVKKVWGKEEYIVNENYCGKILTVNEGCMCSLHCHPRKAETFFVKNGCCKIEIGAEIICIVEGDIVDIKPNTFHRFSTDNAQGMVLIEFSTRHEENDVVRREGSHAKPK